MAYKSPIEIIQEEARILYEDAVVKATQPYLISVNKDELIAALKYDRAQYDNGYADGRAARDAEIIRCKDCKHFEYAIRSNGWGECGLGVCGRGFVEDEWYCANGERRDEVEDGKA